MIIKVLIINILFTISLFSSNSIKQNTDLNESIMLSPMDYNLKNKNPKFNAYFLYSKFFLSNKINNNIPLFQQIINSNDRYLNFYESLLKGFYNYYLDNKILGEKYINKAYDRNFLNVQNNVEGIFMQNLFLSNLDIKNSLKVFNNIDICYLQSNNLIKEGCIANNAAINCIKNKSFIFDIFNINNDLSNYVVKYCIINKKREEINNE
jgi:hypothetical protein